VKSDPQYLLSCNQARLSEHPLYRERFIDKNGSIRCRDLLGYDNSAPEGLQAIREQQLVANICKKIERDSAEILEELLREARPDIIG